MPLTTRAGSGHVPVDAWQNTPVTTTVTFDGATTDDVGDFDGTGNPATLFTVTGSVLLRIYATCSTLLTGATATLEVGTATNTAGLIAQTLATTIDAGEIWHDATPDASVELSSVLAERIVSEDVIQTVGTANIDTGVIAYTAVWYPISAGALVS